MTEIKTVREPLFRIVKRGELSLKKAVIIRAGAILGSILFCCILCGLFFSANPIKVLGELFNGAFGSSRRIWLLLRDTALLLCVSLALLPAFKMKFWNLGGNGQVLIGALVTVAIMRSQLAANSTGFANVLMVVCSVAAGAVWAVIPAIFKAFFKTNESLFTLMMNYIATGLVSYFTYNWAYPETSLGIVYTGHLPKIANDYMLTLIVAVLVTTLMFFYMKKSKQGYEIAVVGESEKTAKYAGMNVKKIIIRTLAISGAVCGLVGLLLAGSINHSINMDTANNMGFTGIMVAWLAKFNPIIMVFASLLVVFVTKGMGQVQSAFGVTNNSITNLIIAIVYFIIIGCEFFITYKVMFRKNKGKAVESKADFMSDETANTETKQSEKEKK